MDYLNSLIDDSRPARSAYQRVFDMIDSAGKERFSRFKQELVKYNFFQSIPSDQVFGIEKNLMNLVDHFHNAALGLGMEKRILLLHGPVGSAKSTIARILKRGIENYSLDNPLFAYRWSHPDTKPGEPFITMDGIKLFNQDCMMHEDPLRLVDSKVRGELIAKINASNKDNLDMRYDLHVDGDLCPHCRLNYKALMDHYSGDWEKVMQHVEVYRLLISEKDRIGIATFQPKDEKNQDSTELTGNIDLRKIAIFGSDSDPRAFNLDGELCRANRGVIEFIEMLKLERAFLYDLLGAAQEGQIKPKKFPLVSIDEVILSHTNEEELMKLRDDELMKAFKDRTVRIDVPYNLNHGFETMIYLRDFTPEKAQKHIAPHTLSIPSLWAVLTRLEGPKEEVSGHLNLMQKAKLYRGDSLPGFTEDTVKKLMEDAVREGLDGISPRFIQDAIGGAIVTHEKPCVNVFMVLDMLRKNLKTSSLVNKEEDIKNYEELLERVEKEYEYVVKEEVKRAITSDESDLEDLCNNYILNVKAFTNKERVRNRVTGKYEEPNERLMRSIEEKVGVTDAQVKDFRGSLMNYIASLALDGRKFTYQDNEQLHKALSNKLFEDAKDKIKFKDYFEKVISEEDQQRMDLVKERLIDEFGYCDVCSTDVLSLVASIFARGDGER